MLSLNHLIKDVPSSSEVSPDARAWLRVYDPHVMTPSRENVKSIFKDIRKQPNNMTKEKRQARLRTYLGVVALHRKNRDLYYSVMGGA